MTSDEKLAAVSIAAATLLGLALSFRVVLEIMLLSMLAAAGLSVLLAVFVVGHYFFRALRI